MGNFNNHGRLFTFGCSMTKYSYPTWADIIGSTWDYYENWGKPSAGNEFIFNSIIECDIRNQFTSNDTILIMWSGIARIDYYMNQWKSVKDRFPTIDDELIPSIDGYEMKSYAYISAIDNLLTNKGVDYELISWQSYDTDGIVGNLYKDVLDTIKYIEFDRTDVRYRNPWCKQFTTERLYERLRGEDWPLLEYLIDGSYKKTCDRTMIKEVNGFFKDLNSYDLSQDEYINDGHPLPSSHLAMVEEYFPYLPISDETKAITLDIENKLINGVMYDFQHSNPNRF